MIDKPEVAFYYPGHLWHSGDWVKNLLLFFDGIALLVPEYKANEIELLDPILASPLKEQGLLHYLKPETLVDSDATSKLSLALTSLIQSGAFDALDRTGTTFHALSRSRLGYYGSAELAENLFQELKIRGLAKDSEDGVSIPMHPQLRYLVLILLAQILRPKGKVLGLDLSPATDRFEVVRSLTEILELPTSPSAGHVVALDLQHVGVDLRDVPLDEVLGFRNEHLETHRNYARAVRRFVRELSPLPEEDRNKALSDRQKEMDDLASDLKKISRAAWKRPASFGLSMAGAVWTAYSGDPLGALLATGAGAVGAESGKATDAGAYSYLFSAHERFA